MTVDLDKNKSHVLQVYNDVLNDKSSTDWALFGYEGQTNTLKVVGFGDEGIEELVDELNASKIMYGILRVVDPKTSRTKIILLNWQGEGAPHLRKGICARHLPDVKKLFKGVHITFTARTEEDVDSDMILAAVGKATSTEYNFKERSEHPDKSVPVGTNYKRTNPQSEIDANRRNKFWEEQEAEEKIRKEQEIRRKEDEARRLEKERVERELRDSKHREELNKERNARIVAEKKAEMVAMESGRKKDALSWEKEVKSQQNEEEERTRRADQMRMERKKEAESLIGHKTHQTRSIFESSSVTSTFQNQSSQGQLSKPPPRKLKDFTPANVENVEERISHQKENLAPKKSVGARWPPQAEDPTPPRTPVSVPGKIADWKPKEEITTSSYTSNKNNSYQSTEEVGRSSEVNRVSSTVESTTSSNSVQKSLAHQYSPKSASEVSSVQHSSILSHPQQTTVSSPVSPSSANMPTAPSQISENGGGAEHVLPQVDPNEYKVKTPNHSSTNGGLKQSTDIGPVSPYEVEEIDDLGSVCMTYEVDGVEYQILPEHGLCARALYDYQAADDTEITFDPGDIITNIDQIDVGWWQGVSALGLFGLFPANYVELINGTKIH